MSHKCHITFGNLINGYGKSKRVNSPERQEFPAEPGQEAHGLLGWEHVQPISPDTAQIHGLSFALPHCSCMGSLVYRHSSALTTALSDETWCQTLSSLCVFEFKQGLTCRHKACSNSLAFYIDKPRSLITECLIRDCI